jgi:diguanylate cyclase (GGDEF)-like protein
MTTTPSSGSAGKVFDRLKRAATGAPAPPPEPPPLVVDPVTGLPARQQLHHWVERAIGRSVPTSSRVVVAFASIGLLRDVNDTYGADTGDRLLQLIGQRLQSIDLPGTEVLRYEGAEFALIFEKLNHANATEEIARFLVDLLSAPFDLGGEQLTVSPAVGAAISADNYDNVDELIRDAHRAMSTARDEGTRFATHDETKRGRYQTRIDEARLHDAVHHDEFLLHYQPIVRPVTGELVGFEALLRWKAPAATNAGVLFPGDFLPMLEKTGLSVQVGQWAVAEACRQIAEWNDLGARPAPLFITCNVSPRHLADPGFVDHVSGALRHSGIEPGLLVLDLTEHCLRFNGPDAWPPLRQLTDMGVRLSLDDFGTGVTSLHWLLELALDYVRIDRSFVTGLGLNSYNRAHGLPDPVGTVIRHTAQMADDLGIDVLAEGVETDEEAAAVRELEIPLAQGYLYGHPEPAETAATRVDPTLDRLHVWDPNDVMENPVTPPPADG